jgi:hypothetical protein
MHNFTNQIEDKILKSIFKDTLSIYTYEDTKTYQILFNNKYYELIIDKDYPSSYPSTNIELSSDILNKYRNKPMIYQLLYECIKKDELNLDKVDEYTSVIEYKHIEKITEEQFREYKIDHIKIRKKKEGMTGREMFLLERKNKVGLN